MQTETLTWYEPTERLPDAELTVLIEVDAAEGEPVWPGYLDGEEWKLADGMPAANVLRWAEMPKGGGA